MMRIDLTGKKFGRWTVVGLGVGKYRERQGKYTVRRRAWLCRCACGQERSIRSETLRRGDSRSCGCLKDELTSLRCRVPEAARNDVLRSYKKGAKDRDLEWSLSDERAIALLQSNCFYCGAAPDNVRRRVSGEFRYGGIDRVDNRLGYTRDNSVPCCTMCNRAKLGWPEKKFIEWARRLGRYQTEKALRGKSK